MKPQAILDIIAFESKRYEVESMTDGTIAIIDGYRSVPIRRGRTTGDRPLNLVDELDLADDMNALSVIKALDAAGYAIVPKKPTPAMIEAGNQHVDWRMSEDIYTAMVEAAAKTEPST